jgi:hypothetical protein
MKGNYIYSKKEIQSQIDACNYYIIFYENQKIIVDEELKFHKRYKKDWLKKLKEQE